MTRGLSRQQIGVTEELIQAYGERVWELSTNVQIRRGDAIRLLEWDKIEAQRPDTGMSDAEIADAIGLSRDQVLYIRLAMERRRYRRNNYHRLFDLGGGRRFRQDRFVPHEERFTFSDAAMELRRCMRFDSELSARWLRLGYWNGDTLAGLLMARAGASPDQPAIVGPGDPVTYAKAYDTGLRLAAVLLSHGARRGDVVAVRLKDTSACIQAYFAVSLMGGIFFPVPDGAAVKNSLGGIAIGDGDGGDVLSWSALIEEATVVETAPAIDQPPLASDPAVLLMSATNGGAPPSVVHNWQSLLANARAVAPLFSGAGEGPIPMPASLSEATGLAAVNAAVHLGAPIGLPIGDGGRPEGVSLWGLPESLVTLNTDGPGTYTPIRGAECRVVSAEGNVLPPDREGELEVRGPSVAACYAGSADGAAGRFRPGGWFGVGLTAMRDGDGNVRLI